MLSYVVSVLIRIVITRFASYYMLGDENLVYHVATLPITEFFTTLKYEPHPPLFYFFVRILSKISNSLIIQRIILMAISYTTIFLITLFLDRKGILKKYNLYGGLSIFFSSFLFIRIMGEIKQDSLSFPISFIVMGFILYVTDKYLIGIKNKNIVWDIPRNKFVWIFSVLVFLNVILFFIGYIPYLYVFIFSSLFLLSTRKHKYLIVFFVIQASIILGYLSFIGLEQFIINTHRFSWATTLPNSLFLGIDRFIGVSKPYGDLKDILKLVPFVFITAFILKKNKKHYEKITLYLFILLTILGYLLHLWVRPRYMIPTYLLLSIIVAWGIQSVFTIKKYAQYILIVYVFLLFVFSSLVYARDYDHAIKYIIDDVNMQFRFVNNNLYTENKSKPVGIVIAYNIRQLYNKLLFPNDYEQFIPVFIFNPDIKYPNIDMSEVLRYAIYRKLSKKDAECSLYKSGYSNFMLEIPTEGHSVSRLILLDVLARNCDPIFSESTPTIGLFQNCKFNMESCEPKNY